MKKYWIKDLAEWQVIHAPTEEIAKKLHKKFNILGFRWRTGEPYSEHSLWDIYKEETCYSPSEGGFSNLNYYIQEGYQFLTIGQLLDFQDEEKAEEYKLIKEYPGSPKLGTIVTKACDYEHYNFNGGDLTTPIIAFFVENYPEFWEKVVEKEYEILSFYAKNISGKGDNFVDPNYIWYETHKGNGKWSRKGNITAPYSTQEITNHNGYGIHSVKRLSDGEVFTIGDDINFSYKGVNNETITGEYKIERIYFIEKERLSFYVGNGLNLGIKNLLKLKQPLFTTEDGVDIYEGDILWVITNNFDSPFICTTVILKSPNHISGFYKYFSTKEAAEEYILINKSCLSMKEIMPVIGFVNNTTYIDLDKLTIKLKELVKSKI